jgi:hypothetical protein
VNKKDLCRLPTKSTGQAAKNIFLLLVLMMRLKQHCKAKEHVIFHTHQELQIAATEILYFKRVLEMLIPNSNIAGVQAIIT